MDDEKPQQIELFPQYYDETNSNSGRSAVSPDQKHGMLAVKKVICLVIVFIVFSVISYSLGVERGKKLISFNTAAPAIPIKIAPAQRIFPMVAKENLKDTAIKEAMSSNFSNKSKDINPKILKNLNKTGYTIQVASIEKINNIKGMISKLKNKGFSAYTMAKGKYSIICIGRFRAKEEALSYLQKVKSDYPDSMIKRL